MKNKYLAASVLSIAGLLGLAIAAQSQNAAPVQGDAYARPAAQASKSLVLQATQVGQRLVTAGEHGHILLSDDQGKNWRQAQSVPTTTTLTALSFIDDKQGWAVGHGGVIIATKDGGENWRLLNGKLDGAEILFSVWFQDAKHGIAVGPYGSMLETIDGGVSWSKRSVAQGEDGERHLNQIFAGPDDILMIAAEAGTVFRSMDKGQTWQVLKMPYKGSLWGGLKLADGTLVLYGMRGHVLHSTDKGVNWIDVAAGDQSFTGATQLSDGTLVLVGLGGAVARSHDGAKSFATTIDAERTSYTAVVQGIAGKPVLFGVTGVQSGTTVAASAH
jgi:photosystem II stability/assembly factor-like uncharacterized protein